MLNDGSGFENDPVVRALKDHGTLFQHRFLVIFSAICAHHCMKDEFGLPFEMKEALDLALKFGSGEDIDRDYLRKSYSNLSRYYAANVNGPDPRPSDTIHIVANALFAAVYPKDADTAAIHAYTLACSFIQPQVLTAEFKKLAESHLTPVENALIFGY